MAARRMDSFVLALLLSSLFLISPTSAFAFSSHAPLAGERDAGLLLWTQDSATALAFFADGLPESAQRASAEVDLLGWVRAHVVAHFPDGHQVAKYDRRLHFGGWIRPGGDNCYDTRARVLTRDAVPGTIAVDPYHPCIIKQGLWREPYVGTDEQNASALQIDHVVPLKHMYYAGAFAWNFAKRCNYANFMGNAFQLLTVSGHENMSKGDRGPDKYLPPSRAFRCRYIGIWMRVKAIWNLTTEPSEFAALQSVAQACSGEALTMPMAELDAQRRAADAIVPSCQHPDPANAPASQMDNTQPAMEPAA